MRFAISREDLIKPLTLVAGVVERRQTLPVLSNILIVVDGDQLTLTGTDLEVELLGRVTLTESAESGEITVPARKLMDICKTLPEDALITLQLNEDKITLKSGRSRFTLTTLPASDFPSVEESPQNLEFSVQQSQLKRLIDRTSIAMAQQDVRYYLNGMLFEIQDGRLRAVATDGHRLAMSETEADVSTDELRQVIIPRKGVMELNRLFANDSDESVHIVMSSNHIRAVSNNFTFTSKLVDGKFPDYQQVIPKNSNHEMLAEREPLRQVLSRTAILSNEKYRGVRLIIDNDLLQVFANNPEQEEAEESLPVKYDAGESGSLEIGFNVSYLLDVLSVTASTNVRISLADANSSILIEEIAESSDSIYVVMPMRL